MKNLFNTIIVLPILFCLSILLSSCATETPVEVENNATTENTVTSTESLPEPEPDLVEGDYKYVILPNGTAKITQYTGKDKIVNIPSSLNGYIVTKIGVDSFAVARNPLINRITDIVIPESITHIESNVFFNLEKLVNITIPESVTSIDMYAFHNTPFLNNKTEEFVIINKHLIKYNGNEENVIIPEGVEIINDAFHDDEDVFQANTNIKSVVLPNSLIKINNRAFMLCENLESVTIPDKEIEIGYDAFLATKFLNDKLKIDNYIVINNILVYCNQLYVSGNIALSETRGITKIAPRTFSNFSILTGVILPDGLKKIGEKAFYNCIYLKSITIPDSVVEIEEDAFLDCINLTISCSEGSYAQQYCIENNIEFEII